MEIAIFTLIMLIGGIFMIADAYSPALRLVLQVLCAVVLAIPIAIFLIRKLERKLP